MSFKSCFGALAGSVLAAAALPAGATRVDLLVYENADGADESLLDLWVDVTDSAGKVNFTFHHDGADGVVGNVYFENTAAVMGLLTSPTISFQSAGVSFSSGSAPPNPAQPGFLFGGTWAGNLFSAQAGNPKPANGINHGGAELLTVSFSASGIDAAGVVAALNNGSFRIAQHVLSIGTGEFSVWTVNPAPGSLALLGVAGLVARRRRG